MSDTDDGWADLQKRCWSLLIDEERRARTVINLVASENAQSVASRIPMLFDGYNRYFFRSVTAEQDYGFRGAGAVGKLEQDLANPLLQEMTGAKYVSVRPLSGLNAMLTVLAAYGGPPGTAVLTLDGAQGGHSATRPLAQRLGLRVLTLPGDGPHRLDLAATAELCRRERIRLIYLDQSNALFPYLDVRQLRKAAGEDVTLHVDCSHWLGLILGGQLPNPLDLGAHTIGGSTHKTFPGPQKGFVATRSESHWDQYCANYGALISSHHFASAVSLGLALAEYVGPPGRAYAAQVVSHAQALGRALTERGFWVFGADAGWTGTHQLWIDTARQGLAPATAAERLYQAGIRVTDLPYLPGIDGPGIRLGVHEATHLGMPAEQIDDLADLMVDAVHDVRPSEQLAGRTAALRARWRPRPASPGAARALRELVKLIEEQP